MNTMYLTDFIHATACNEILVVKLHMEPPNLWKVTLRAILNQWEMETYGLMLSPVVFLEDSSEIHSVCSLDTKIKPQYPRAVMS